MLDAAEARGQEIREEAARDAERVRREATISAARVWDGIAALERPLGQLVTGLRAELDTAHSRLGYQAPVDSDIALAKEPMVSAPDEGDEPDDDLREATAASDGAADTATEDEISADETPDAETTRDEETPPGEEGPADEPADPAREDTPETGLAEDHDDLPSKRGLRSRLLRRRDRAFIQVAGHCAVCERSLEAGTPENLAASGWTVSGEIGLCPVCQSEGWRLPKESGLPHRRGTA